MAARQVARDFRLGRLSLEFDVAMPDCPARPRAPELLPPRLMPKRGRGGSERNRNALWHSLAHIEFVAIDLALDMAGRFGAGMGERFVADFLSVAADEAMHFALLDRHLRTMGSGYGALPAHDGLWQSAASTCHDVTARLAVVPMLLEARGLDVTPLTIERVRALGDRRGVSILDRILEDEIRHVRFGVIHFERACEIKRLSPEPTWNSLVERHFSGRSSPQNNSSTREAIGLSRYFNGPLAS